MEDSVWFIKEDFDGSSKGPFYERDIMVMLETNEITSQTFVRTKSEEGQDGDWRRIVEIDHLRTQIINDRFEALERIENFFAVNTPKDPEEIQNDEILVEDPKKLEILKKKKEDLGEEELVDLVDLKLKNTINKEAQEILKKKGNAKTQGLTEEQMKKIERNKRKAAKRKEKNKEKWYVSKINTNVYIEGLPTENEVPMETQKEFFLKAGVIRLNPATGEERIKLYRDSNGILKGDALISYVKEESVALAIEMLGDREIAPGHKISITQATFEMKGESYKKREKIEVDEIAKIKYQANVEKMLTWDDDMEGEGLRIVVVKHMFTPDLILSDPELIDAIREDIESECDKNGWKIKRLVIHEFHPEGVAEIKFEKPLHAQECIQTFHKRFYGGQELDCDYYDGKTNYKNFRESKEDEQERIDNFGKWQEEKIEGDDLFDVEADIDHLADEMIKQMKNDATGDV